MADPPPPDRDVRSLGEGEGEDSSPPPKPPRRHQKVQSWGGAVAGFAQDLFGGKPPLPPPPRRSLSEEEEYHKRNQQFLQQVNAVQSKQQAQTTSFGSPSPNTKFRKRLQLKAIEEDDGQSFVVMKSLGSGQAPPPPPGPSLAAAPTQSSYDETEDDHVALHRSIKFNDEAPDDMSSLGGDYYNQYSNRSPLNANYSSTNNHTNNNHTATNNEDPLQPSHTKAFEQELEERFQRQKQDMERKLAGALQQNAVTIDRTAFINSYMDELERERTAMLAQWKAEMRSEEDRIRKETSRHRLAKDCYDALFKPCIDPILSTMASLEVILSNMPLTIGAVGLSWVTQGVVWFKFTEEMVESCQHVHYFSNHCTFQEFPGCFECDTTNPYYRMALKFHWFCSFVAALACVLFLAKVILAPEAVLDMLKNPTTSTPAGVFCIAMVCTFAGQYGILGEIIVLVTSLFHVLLAFGFFYMAFVRFRLMPDPGWFPNVVGISYAAVKTWIYFPRPGLVLMALCTAFFLGTFFISVVRVALNHKIAAPVCWIQLSAPSITLYALTLVSQPTPREEALEENSLLAKQQHHQFLENYFMPAQHFFMLLTMVGLISAAHSLYVRWPTFKHKPFSPAHVAFCFPTLSHTNAIQAYRASLISLSPMPPGSPFKKILFGYWCFFLVAGTILNIVFTIKYVLRIPEWTKPDLTGEEAPPAPSDTIVHEMMDETGAHETIRQPFVSPAVLEANEAGLLVRVKRGTEEYRLHGPFVRTRKLTSLGFDMMLSELELREERARLLDWVAKNAPRKRNRTMSVPGVMHLRNKNDGRDVYGTFTDLSEAETLVRGHTRSKTTTGTSFV